MNLGDLQLENTEIDDAVVAGARADIKISRSIADAATSKALYGVVDWFREGLDYGPAQSLEEALEAAGIPRPASAQGHDAETERKQI